MSHLHTPNYSPSASGRTTPLGHFRDLVSALRENAFFECGHLFDLACKTVQGAANTMLISMSNQVHDAMKNFKTEADSEAHQVCTRPASRSAPLMYSSARYSVSLPGTMPGGLCLRR